MRGSGILALVLTALCASATDYHVGEGQPYGSVGAVPWASLQPGDNVYIHWRPAPYKEKWVICRQGTASQPISVIGVPNAGGQLPVIEGIGAVTAPGVNYWNEERSIIKIGGANTPADTMPKYIVIDSLEIRGAQPAYTFRGDDGTVRTYSASAAAIYVEKGENITIRNSILHDAGNGLFIASSDSAVSRDILIEGNYIYGNGISGSLYEHNSYTAAIGITFQYNRYGPLRPGAGGNALKDRSAGLAVRYNWIEGGNRQLDLVDGEDAAAIRSHPDYGTTHVFGNVLIENAGDGNRQMVHYGGDSGATRNYRKGVMYFYNNTLVSYRTDRTTIFRLSTNSERCDARNNIIYATAAGSTVSLLDTNGVLDFLYNWIKPGWAVSFGKFRGKFNNLGGNVQTASPGFLNEPAQDFHLASGSAAANAGTALPMAALPLLRQYVKHQSSEPRPTDMALDIGAFEKQ